MKSFKSINLKVIEDIIFHLLNSQEVINGISKIGTIKKNVGSTYYLNPLYEQLEAISVTVNNNKILSIGLTLRDFHRLEYFANEIGIIPVVKENNYDEKRVYTFKKDGYLISVNIKNIQNSPFSEIYFKELDIRF